MWDLIVSVPDHCLSFYFEFYAATKHFCQVLKTTFISHKGKQIATDADIYTPNYIESKMFRYKLNLPYQQSSAGPGMTELQKF